MNKTVHAGRVSKGVNSDRHPLLVVSVFFYLISSVLTSNTLVAADLGHEVLFAHPDNCLQEIGSQLRIEGGTFVMGDNYTYREEGPAHEVTLFSFWIDTHEVTNGQFAEFVADTGYVTVAERQPNPADWPGVPVESLVPGSTL